MFTNKIQIIDNQYFKTIKLNTTLLHRLADKSIEKII